MYSVKKSKIIQAETQFVDNLTQNNIESKEGLYKVKHKGCEIPGEHSKSSTVKVRLTLWLAYQ